MSTRHAQRNRIARRVIGIIMIAVIGVIQAIGTILVGVGGVVLKAASVLMFAAAGILFLFTDFSGINAMIVGLTSAGMFWLPEVLALVLVGLTFLQGRIVDAYM